MVIEQWGFFSVTHQPWHGASVYEGHLRRPLTLTSVAKRLAVELSLPVFTIDIGLSRLQLRFEHPTFSMQSERSNRLPFLLNLFKWDIECTPEIKTKKKKKVRLTSYSPFWIQTIIYRETNLH